MSSVASRESDLSPVAVEEIEGGKRKRRPYHFYQNRANTGSNASIEDPGESPRPTSPVSQYSDSGTDPQHAAQLARYRYYTRLAPQPNSQFQMPDHIVPTQFFLLYIPAFIDRTAKQSSLVTILTIWNTMMGTSVLVMPWAFGQAGFGCAIAVIVFMATLTLYTALRTLLSVSNLEEEELLVGESRVVEFTDMCRLYLGKFGEYASIIFSLVALLGAMIVYWVLMSNFAYHGVLYIYKQLHETQPMQDVLTSNITWQVYASCGGIYCPSRLPDDHPDRHHRSGEEMMDKYFDEYKTVPFYLIAVLFPLLQFKSPTFFTKFNALGVLSVIFLFGFIIAKAVDCGMNIEFTDTHSLHYTPQYNRTFLALPGTLGLAFFIHNCVISIMRNQKHPEKNKRDLSIGYFLVALTYLLIAILLYISFPLAKSCIEDNILNNFVGEDILTFVARIFLFFQMLTVFPLLVYLFRVQVLHFLFNNIWPSLKHVLVLNILLVTVCVLFARFLPKVGVIIRFTGAICGLAYIFTLPCLVHLMQCYKQRTLNWGNVILHLTIIALGIANFIGQFLPLSN